ncbi:MAG TPA: hypothetical protein EYP04_03915, partial [Anaerolineae bacterium]|nr:hypothetical protein [Anaerolineae bacterium]
MRRRFFVALVLILALTAVLVGFWQSSRLDQFLPGQRGSFFTLYIEPASGKAPVLGALADAQHRLRIKMYQITDPEFVQAVKDAATRGVKVRLILEQNPYGGSSQNVDVALDVQEAGVQFHWEPRTIKYLHEKSIVVDDRYALVMTANLTTSAFTAYREYILKDTNPRHVAEITHVFDADWERVGVDLREEDLFWAPENARQRLVRLIDDAGESLWIEHQNLQDEEIIEHLITAAQRGVDVRYVSTPRYPLGEDTDEPGRDAIRQGGAQVRYLDAPYVHAKVMIIDGQQGFVGSENFTTNSLDHNRELGVLFAEPAPVAQMIAQFEEDWAEASSKPFTADCSQLAGDKTIDHTEARKYFYCESTVRLTVKATYNS